MKNKSVRTLLLGSTILLLSPQVIDSFRGIPLTMNILLCIWVTVLTIGVVGMFLSLKNDMFDLLAFITLAIIALFFIGSYSGGLHLKKESTDAINSVLSLSNGSTPCKGSYLWLTLYIPIKNERDVENFRNFLDEFNLNPHLMDRRDTENRVYVDMCALGNVSGLKEMKERASELGWPYHITNMTALQPNMAGENRRDELLRVDIFLYTPKWHEWHYFKRLSKYLAELGILTSILALLLRLPRG